MSIQAFLSFSLPGAKLASTGMRKPKVHAEYTELLVKQSVK